jgi:hypothetical protein
MSYIRLAIPALTTAEMPDHARVPSIDGNSQDPRELLTTLPPCGVTS